MDVLKWSQTAQPGERVTYHRGTENLPWETGRSARHARYKGLVFLAQKRHGAGFLYQATRITRETAWRLGIVDSELSAPAPQRVSA